MLRDWCKSRAIGSHNGLLNKVVCLDLYQRLLVVEVFKVAVDQVQSRSVGPIAANAVKSIQIEKDLVSLHIVILSY